MLFIICKKEKKKDLWLQSVIEMSLCRFYNNLRTIALDQTIHDEYMTDKADFYFYPAPICTCFLQRIYL